MVFQYHEPLSFVMQFLNMNHSRVTIVKKTLDYILWLALIAYFAHQFAIQWDKFQAGETTVATSLSAETELWFPDLVFCHKNGFKKPVRGRLGSQSYLNNVLFPDVDLLHIKSSVLGTLSDKSHARNIPTTYNGLCRVFHFNEGYSKRAWLKFQMNKSEEYHLFLLVPNTTFYLINQDFYQMPKMLDIQSSANVILQPKIFTFETDCVKYTEADRVICLKELIRENLTQSNFPCVPLTLEQNTNGFSDKICQDNDEAEVMFETIWPIVSSSLSNSKCGQPCNQRSYDLDWLPMSGESFEDIPNYHTLYVFFGTEFVQKQTRYILVDFSAWLSNTGGLLGLLLGFSLYSIGTSIINRLFSLAFE